MNQEKKYLETIICDICGKTYKYSNSTAHRKTKFHKTALQNFLNEEKKELKEEKNQKNQEDREIKIPLPPNFDLESKNYSLPKIKTNEGKLKPIVRIEKKDSVEIINEKLKFMNLNIGLPQSSIYNILNGALHRHQHLIFKFILNDGQEKFMTLKKDGYWQKFLSGNYYYDKEELKGSIYQSLIENILSNRMSLYGEIKWSDEWDYMELLKVNSATLVYGEDAKYGHSEIGYFEYHNLTNIDLSKYQVYKENEESKYEQCLIHTLKMCEIEDDLIMKCISTISEVEKSQTGIVFKPSMYVKNNKMVEISEIIKKTIHIEYFKDSNGEVVQKTIGDFKESINLGIFKNHIFINDELPYTRYSIINYNTIKNKPNFNRIYDSGRHYKDIKLSVCMILSLMFKNNLLKEIKDIDPTNLQSIHHFTDEKLLNNIDQEQREFKYNEKTDIKTDIFYADLENINSNTKNIPFLAGIINENKNEPNLFIGLDCVINMFEYVIKVSDKKKQIVIYFHNMKYDFSLMKQFIHIISICEKNNTIYSVEILYKKCKIILKDSYKLFSESLYNFGKAFKLNVSKEEGIGYDYYTKENFSESKTLISEYIKFVKPKEQKQFFKNIENKFQNDGKYFDSLSYYLHYLNLDVIVLQQAMKKFDNLMIQTFGKSIHNFLTISSYSDNYFIRNGCYDKIYEVTGNLRLYLSKAIYGGRVNVLEKVKKTCINDRINDFDGVSLYPSSIKKLCDESGFPIGRCKKWNSLIDLKTVSTYVLTVCITKINKKQNNPFIAYRNNNKIDYINDLTGPLVVVIDKITLEDYIEFHQIEYTILDGVYWDEGFNNTFGEKINYMFNERLKQKSLKTDQGDILQNIYKLMLNSAYGKTILSSTDTSKIVKDEKYFLKYMFKNYNSIQYAQKINDRQYLITQNKTDQSYNRAIVGINILSMSKRIMNQVMGLASDHQIDVFYQDTDSMHLLDKDISKLDKLFKEKYDKELIGKNMCQFHSDFKLGNCKDVIAVRSYFLGRKCYMDVLEGKNMDGKIENGYHIRMKGISESAFDEVAKGDPENIFKRLCNGETIKFNLTNSNSVKFKFSCDGVKKLDYNSFTRDVKF